MSPKTRFQLILSFLMLLILSSLLYWQEERFALVRDCQAVGGEWDGGDNRCRPLPKIYIQRGLQRS